MANSDSRTKLKQVVGQIVSKVKGRAEVFKLTVLLPFVSDRMAHSMKESPQKGTLGFSRKNILVRSRRDGFAQKDCIICYCHLVQP